MRRPWAVLLLALTGCERGCLSSWLSAHGAGPTGASSSDPRTAPLAAFDCPDGLVRCVGGVAQASKLGSVPASCTSSPDKPHACDCPFVDVVTCTHGCVVDDVTLVASPADASRTCALAPGVALWSPAGVAVAPTHCEGEAARFRCQNGVVAACVAGSGQPVSTCSSGCASEGEELDEEQVDIQIATALLCKAHRESVQR